MWAKTFDGALHDRDVAFGVDAGPTGQIAITGLETLSAGGGSVQQWFVLMGPDGTVQHDDREPGFIGWDVALNDEDAVALSTGYLEPGNKAYRRARFGLTNFSGGATAFAADDVGRSFIDKSPSSYWFMSAEEINDGVHIIAAAPASEPLSSTFLPDMEAAGVAGLGDFKLAFAGSKLAGGDYAGPYVAVYDDDVFLWSLEDAAEVGRPSGIAASDAGDAFYVLSRGAIADAIVLTAWSPNGSLLWRIDDTLTLGSFQPLRGIAVGSNGDIVMLGHSVFDGAFLRKYSPQGGLVWERTIGFSSLSSMNPMDPWDSAIGPDDTIYVVGSYYSEATDYDMVIVAVEP